MESNIHLSNSDHELVLNKRDANTNTTANNSVNNTNKSILLKHTNSLPIEEDSNIDFNQQNNQYYEEFQRDRPQSLRPRMVTRSSVNYHQQSKYKLQSNSEQQNLNKINKSYNINNYPILTPYNTRNNSIHQSSDYISLLHSDKPLVTTTTTTTITTTTTTTATTTTTTILIDNMDSQLLSSSISPEFMGNTSKDTHIDDLLLSNKKLNRTIKYLDNTKLIRRESKSYSTTISPIPLISYHQNVLPNNMDLYPIIMDRNNNNNSTIIDKKFLNNNNNDDNNTNNSSIIKNIKHKLNINKTLNTTKARVELVLIFVKVGQVDTVNERYQADIFLQARWREPLLDAMWNKSSLKSKSYWQTNPSIENPFTDLTSKRQLNTLKLQDDEFWNPRLLIDNAEGEPIEIVSHEVEFIEPDFEAYLVEKRRIKGIFHETLELRHFPFDCQDLSVTITCDRTTDEVELVASPTEVSQVDVRCAADSQEWKIFHHVDIKSIEIQTGYSPGTSKRRHPGLVFTSRSARRSGYFLVNMILISCVLCLLSFAAFSVPANENRLQLSLLLLLTTVTFKFAASQNLPKISYLTYLDKVVLVNFFMLVILTVWHAIARAVSASKPKFLEYEHYVMYSLLSCYCIGSVLFGLTVYLDAGSRRRLMKRKDVEFNQYKQQIEAQKQHHSILSVSLEEWLSSPHNSITDNLLDKNDPLINNY
ncbi:unnamed protein product [Schistosoma margrebowiei]|uniref:Neurotransmitter-gated ion-channel ligand-binding domain-containing protein n=1 Tax=Schistosoma margrebowiei TaxID=48269 RepID=A0AA85AIJ0_9TREM|nr:unnamed protein product [Schistosoma margrebowiei]